MLMQGSGCAVKSPTGAPKPTHARQHQAGNTWICSITYDIGFCVVGMDAMWRIYYVSIHENYVIVRVECKDNRVLNLHSFIRVANKL